MIPSFELMRGCECLVKTMGLNCDTEGIQPSS